MSDLLIISFVVVFILIVLFLFQRTKNNEEIRDLERRISDLLTSQLKEVRGSVDGSSKAMHQQISSFTKEATQIREDLRKVEIGIKDVSSFQDIFKSPKLRGQWGEASLEHILSQHFPKELYKMQYLFSSGEQVDAILRLPNEKVLSIDSKFPVDNFSKMVYADKEQERDSYKKVFLSDVKDKVNEISSKYILKSEGTVDFAIMFIPAEAVYYEILNNISKEIDIISFAWSKKVVLASPNTIYLTLRTIEHWFRDTQISRKTQEILKRLERIYLDADKLTESFRRLGNHIRNANSSYESSEQRLFLLEKKVKKLVKIGDNKKKIQK